MSGQRARDTRPPGDDWTGWWVIAAYMLASTICIVYLATRP